MIQVGIPRGLFYFYHYPLWKTFFTDLGAQVITSSPTNRQTIDHGIEHTVDECCFPIKVYFGHVRELMGKNPDYILAPRLVSTEPRSYICPKFMGIPDMIRATFNPCPPLIDITVDCSRDTRQLWQDIYRIGNLFNTSKKGVRQAYEHGGQEMKRVRVWTRQGYSPDEAIALWENDGEVAQAVQYGPANLCVGVLGHGYSLYDTTISLKLIEKLRHLGCRVVLLESCSRDILEKEAARLPKKMFWTLGRKMLGSALMMDKNPAIDGIVYLACFGCGPDSMVGDIIARKVEHKPFLLVTIDEHSGEGGLVTRLEAFCDMLRRKKVMELESDLSPYGVHAHSP
jgi:predicted nucleotide-binding protein (sugar kinase/HSP70/actin superfamily)